MNSPLIYCLSLLFMLATQANGYSQERETNPGIQVNITKDLQKVYVHNLKPKQNLYQLAKKFDLPLVYLARINSIEKDAILSVGSEILIPIKDDLIKNVKSSPFDVPVMYQVKPKETIFRIARIYFNTQIEEIQRMNDLETLKLDINQNLQIGWIDLDLESNTPVKTVITNTNKESEYVLVDTISTIVKDSINEITIVEENDSLSIVELMPAIYKRGIAFWNKSGDSSDLFVMHDTAKPQTEIELYNPLVNKRVVATVVAKLPSNAYPADINLVISPAVARQLGAIDSRFAVEMKYYK